jgi:hypothetical protein
MSLLGGVVEVENQGSLSEPPSLWIGSASVLERTIAAGFFSVVMALLVYGCFFGPDPINIQTNERRFTTNATLRFRLCAAPISGFNRFVEFGMTMNRKIAQVDPISFFYDAHTEHRGQRVRSLHQSVHHFRPTFSDPSPNSSYITLFHDSFIRSDYAAITLMVMAAAGGSYDGVNLWTLIGTHDHANFQAYFRLVASGFQIASLWQLRHFCEFSRFQSWPLEFQLTIPLLFLAVLSNNPLYVFHIYRPRYVFVLIDALATPLFHALVYLAVLAILHSVAAKSSRPTTVHFTLAAAAFAAEFMGKCRHVIDVWWGPAIGGSRISEFQYAVDAAFAGWALWLLAKVIGRPDMTERMAQVCYCAACGVVVFMALCVRVCARALGLLQMSVAGWLFDFLCSNIFTLVLAYYHRPYDVAPNRELGDEKHALQGPHLELCEAVPEYEDAEDDDAQPSGGE